MANITEGRPKSKLNRDFPLWLHPSGRWCRKIRGQFHYFGREKSAALEEWLRVKDNLLAGQPRPPKGVGVLTVADLCDRFLHAKRHLLDTRELSPRTWHSYRATCVKLAAAIGRHRAADSLTASDFEMLRSALAEGRGPVALRGDVLNVRMVFKYGYDNGLIANPVRYGQGFKIPAKAVLRRDKQAKDARMFEASELREIISKTARPLRAMVLLGINCAFGQSDVSRLPEPALDLDGGWITFPRPKTAIERRCPLWPETTAALREALLNRNLVNQQEDIDLVFLTRCRQRWVRFTCKQEEQESGVVKEKGTPIDAVACEFAKVLTSLGMRRPGLGFYALRHTFRTVADKTLDFPAVRLIMGHADGSIDDVYREYIDDERLRKVTEHVRAWLWPPKKTEK